VVADFKHLVFLLIHFLSRAFGWRQEQQPELPELDIKAFSSYAACQQSLHILTSLPKSLCSAYNKLTFFLPHISHFVI